MATIQQLDTERKVLRCLGCGAPMVTDRCHRLCERCSERNEGVRLPRLQAVLTAEGRRALAEIERQCGEHYMEG